MFRTLRALFLVTFVSTATAATAPTTPTFMLSWGNFGSAPAQFSNPNGVATDVLGNVYVADTGNNCIQKFDRSGNFIAQWGSNGSGNGQFANPLGVATDAAGNVYVADLSNHRIQKFTSTGTYLTQWGVPGSSYVATDAAGSVYVAGNDHIVKFSSTGTYLTEWGSSGSAVRFRGLATDAADNVYVADEGLDRILKFSSTGTYLTEWGGVNEPHGVGTDPVGNVYVTDNASIDQDRVQKFDHLGNLITQWGSYGSGNGQFNQARGVATDAAGNVYIADNLNNRIQKFSSAGTPLAEPSPAFLLKWGSFGDSAGQFNYPSGTATDAAGNVYVADSGNNRIQNFSGVGAYLTQWGSNGSGNGQFSYPVDVATTGGLFYVVDSGNNRIQGFDHMGNFFAQWGSLGSGNGQFNAPSGVATDAAANVYVADYFNDRIQKFTNAGIYLTQWGSFGSGDGQFLAPADVTTDAAGNVYVADRGNDRIQKFSSTGTYLTQWGSTGQFYGPRSVATDAAGNVYVADMLGIRKFSGAGAHLTQWGLPAASPRGVTVDASGNVYVTEDEEGGRVQKFASPPSIALISDVGNDQGRQVQIRLLRSSADAPGSGALVTGYEVYRRNDPLPAPTLAGIRKGGSAGAPAASPAALSPANVELAGWTYLMTAPAHGESEYNVVVPTLVDATSTSLEYSAFMVRAATTDPFTFFDSGAEYGFSVDNLSPPAPTPFTAGYASGSTRLHWGVSLAGDFATFKLYRGSSGDFVPGTDDLIAMTTDTTYTDAGPAGSFYKLSAVDRNGNEGLYATVAPWQTTDAPTESAVPLTFALEGSNPVPLGRMTVHFTLPTGGHARLELFDVRGRLVVARDVGSLGAGRHAVDPSAGHRLASGVYFVRLTQGPNMLVVRQVVLN